MKLASNNTSVMFFFLTYETNTGGESSAQISAQKGDKVNRTFQW